MTHIGISELTDIGSDNGLLPSGSQAIIWNNAGINLIGQLGTNFSENLAKIYTFSFKKMDFKMSSAKWQPFCFDLNMLTSSQSAWSTEYWDIHRYYIYIQYIRIIHRPSLAWCCEYVQWKQALSGDPYICELKKMAVAHGIIGISSVKPKKSLLMFLHMNISSRNQHI